MKIISKTVTSMIVLIFVLSSSVFAYDVQYEFSDGIAVVKNDGKFGYITESGDVLVPCEYDYAFDFADDMANVVKNNKCGYINTSGVLVIPCDYDGATDFSEGAAAVQKNGKWAYIDKEGTPLTKFAYDGAGFFNEGFARVRIGQNYGYINLHGQEIVPCMYDETNAYIALYNAPKNQPADKYSVIPMTSNVTVDGEEKTLDAYEIKDYNYVKLRSLAAALEESFAPVIVDWDEEKNSIIINSAFADNTVDKEEDNILLNELSIGIIGGADGPTAIFVSEDTDAVLKEETDEIPIVYTSTCDVYYNNKPVTLYGYEINGNNYFKLRDMTELFGIAINWNESAQEVEIFTK